MQPLSKLLPKTSKYENKKSKHPILELVNAYYRVHHLDELPKEVLKEKYPYGERAKNATKLLRLCKKNFGRALYEIESKKYTL